MTNYLPELVLAKTEDFPPLAQLYIDGAHGTLIHKKWVVTAAHASFCALPGNPLLINGKKRIIKSLHVHPQYTSGKGNDIALIELEQVVTDVSPAVLYNRNDEQGKSIWFIGIGGTGNGLTGQTIDNAQNQGVLRKAQNTVLTATDSQLTFRFNRGEQAQPLEGVSGGGDSGGPAFIKNGEAFYVLGVSSRFVGGDIGEYGITEYYSRISHFYDWITDHVNGTAEKSASNANLKNLPSGLTEDNLNEVCTAIMIR